eukprot:CAMPEP_0113872978 /NCGR_PEP_ID=MMETSP0780_2-20120614/3516_1 /TAXON_ID=652834 /ORGANISM="Palpitomonas bilix" /LENGTH=275 /DNA_ID=CAMNT_0000858575 /DNA_START=49 /DNA_END=876 /DNA_ORIENTATION=+ /assembly_acc=CAM_ASM_000599
MPKANGFETALVTGASAGMGKAFAIALAKEGYTVFAAARRMEAMEELKEFGIIPIKMDITKEEDVQTVVSTVLKDHKSIDILINNAGFGLYGAVEDVKIDEARYQFEVNIFGLARLTQLLIPYMRDQKRGRIINISSIGGKIYTPLGAWYHATKHALEGWSDCLRVELAPFGVDVVIIEPGLIKTEFADVLNKNLQATSARGAYNSLANKLIKATEKEAPKASDPQVIVDLVVKAVRAKTPNTRYAGGRMATMLLTIRAWFSDRFFDSQLSKLIS